jgi:hypothetical protein
MRRLRSVLVTTLLLGLVACGDSSSPTTTTPATPATPATTAPDAAFTLAMSPPRVNRTIPGERPLVLIMASGAAGSEIALTATTDLAGASVRTQPAAVKPGEAAEVWITIPEVAEEVPFAVTITGQRGAATQTVSVEGSAVPGTDSEQPMALDIADVFLKELTGKVDGLPADRSGLVRGTPVAGLLVVTHYAWFTDAYEINLAWHIMVAPDDWAELSLRPRGALTPTKAYRLSSWSTALGGGPYTVTEIPPPETVTR